MADASVRQARTDDARAITRLLVDEWVMSPLPSVTEIAASLDREQVAATWEQAVSAPPSPRHLLLVACAGADVVGVLAAEPLEGGSSDSEVLELVVSAGHRRQGHGSRLLAAWADIAVQQGFTGGVTWVRAADDAARAFLAGAGWGPDGGLRELDPTGRGTDVLRQARLVTALADSPGR